MTGAVGFRGRTVRGVFGALAAIAVLVAVPSAANAWPKTIAYMQGSTVSALAGDGQDNFLDIQKDNSDASRMLVVDLNGYPVEPVAPCRRVAGRTDAASCPAGPFVSLYAGDGNDKVIPVDMVRWFGTVPLYVSGGPGDDTLWGASSQNFLDGGSGNDQLSGGIASKEAWMNGGTGDDVITGSGYSDVLSGGGGNDDIWGYNGNDTIEGGPGADRLGAKFTRQANGTGVKQPDRGSDTYLAGPDDDVINSDWDNEADTVRCQAGYDDADVEGRDTTSECERLH